MADVPWDLIFGAAGAGLGALNTPAQPYEARTPILEDDQIKDLGDFLAGYSSQQMTTPQMAPREVRESALGPGRSESDRKLLSDYEVINDRVSSMGMDAGRSPYAAHLQNDARMGARGDQARAAAEFDTADYERAMGDRWRGATLLNDLVQGAATHTDDAGSASDFDDILGGLLGLDGLGDWLDGILGGDDDDGSGDGDGDGGGTSNAIDKAANILSGGGASLLPFGLGALLGWMMTRDNDPARQQQAADAVTQLATAPEPPQAAAGETPEQAAARMAQYYASLTPEQRQAMQTLTALQEQLVGFYLPGAAVQKGAYGEIVGIDVSGVDWNNPSIDLNNPNSIAMTLLQGTDLGTMASQGITSSLQQQLYANGDPWSQAGDWSEPWGQSPGGFEDWWGSSWDGPQVAVWNPQTGTYDPISADNMPRPGMGDGGLLWDDNGNFVGQIYGGPGNR